VADLLALDVAAQGAVPQLDAAVSAAAAQIAADGLVDAAEPLPASEFDAYLKELSGISAAAAGGSDAALGDVRKEAVTVGATPALEDIQIPQLPASLSKADAPFASVSAEADVEGDALLAAFQAELAELEALGLGGWVDGGCSAGWR